MPVPAKPEAKPETTEVAASGASGSSTKRYRIKRGVWNLYDDETDQYVTKGPGDTVELTQEEAERHKRNIEQV